ncbi:nebulin-related-anchoring protein [Lampetra fluviatilis]
MNKPCARCQHPVYPLEKLDCLGQTWHKMCFYCEECETVLTVNNFKSFEKRPYCHAHCPKPNKFTSVLETPLNLNVKQQSVNASENKYREASEKFRTEYHWDMQSREMEHIRQVAHLSSQVEYKKSWDAQKEFYHLPPDVIARNSASEQLYEQEMLVEGNLVYTETPEYKRMVQAQKNVSDVQYKREFKEKKDQFTSVAESWDMRHARVGSALASEVKYREAYDKEMKGHQASGGLEITAGAQRVIEEQQEGRQLRKIRGSFPANETPGYRCAKQAHELASDVKYKAGREQMKGAARFHSLHSEGNLELQRTQKVNKLVSENAYRRDMKSAKGHSVNYCETQQFKSASKAGDLASDLKYKEAYETQVKGHYAGVAMVDKRTEHCMKVANLASKRNYRAEYEEDKAYVNFPATVTPAYESHKKQELYRDPQYRQRVEKLKFTSVSETPEIAQARINAHQLSDMNYRADYEKNKTRFTITQDNPQMEHAKASGDLLSDIKYHEQWQKTKGKGFEMKMDDISLLAARASGALASDIKYREAYEKTKGRSVGSSEYDTKTLHSMHAGRLMNEREYKKGFEEAKGRLHMPMDMLQMQHAQKAQSLASDRDYRTLLHRYTALPSDLKVEWAKKAHQLQSNMDYRADLTWMRGVGWGAEGSLNMEQAKKAGDILSEPKYRQRVDQLKFTSVSQTPEMAQARINAHQLSDTSYRSQYEQNKSRYTLTHDTPELLQAKANASTFSDLKYHEQWEKTKGKGFEMKMDDISLLAARASGVLASDIKYREAYEKTKGRSVGSSEYDTKTLHSMHAGRLMNEREYKKGFEEAKGRLHMPMDMLQMQHAQKAQSLASDRDYRTLLHRYTALPSDLNVEWAKKAHQLQSNMDYRADLTWMRGVGWGAEGSLNMEQAKKAGDILSEPKYRQRAKDFKFTSVSETPEIAQARINARQLSDTNYRSQYEQNKSHYTLTHDTPDLLQAKANASTFSDLKYREQWEKTKGKGFEMKMDDISLLAARASGVLASDIKYREAYEKTKGRSVGSSEYDTKTLHSMHAGRLINEREYKKGFEEAKGRLHMPMDMLQMQHAQKAQSLASDRDYRTLLHRYTALPSDLNVEWAKKAHQLQSNTDYRADLTWMRGVGWGAEGSLNMEQAKKAGDILSEPKYRQRVDQLKFTSVSQTPEMAQARINAHQLSDTSYRSQYEQNKSHYTLTHDTPDLLQAKANASAFSDIKYREQWEKTKGKGFEMKMDDISLLAARASGVLASDIKYREAYEKTKGRSVGSSEYDTKTLHSMHAGKLMSEREYKKGFEEAKGRLHLPMDMLQMQHAQKAQSLASDRDYRTLLHRYTALPSDLNVEWAKKAYQLQSDTEYRADLAWMRGVNWAAQGSVHVEQAKRAGELVSDKSYRQHPNSMRFTSVLDTPEMNQAKISYQQAVDRLYREDGEAVKHGYTGPADLPEMARARTNAQNISESGYRRLGQQSRARGYNLHPDAIPFQAARASREIISDYKYKEAFERRKGHYVGASAKQNLNLLHLLQSSHLQSDREYKKGFEEAKGRLHLPMDMLQLLHAQKAQSLASDRDYRTLLHNYTALPSDLKVEWAKKAYQLQSDNLYRSEGGALRGVGWTPLGSLQTAYVKHAGDIISEKKYRQHPDAQKFTVVADSVGILHAKNAYLQSSERRYREAGMSSQHQYTLTSDLPEHIQARINTHNLSDTQYRDLWRKSRSLGYTLHAYDIPFQAAKSSQEISSQYNYRQAFERQKGRHVGAQSAEGDQNLQHCLHASQLSSGQGYRRGFEDTKGALHLPNDMLQLLHAQKAQSLASDRDYRTLLHHYTALPEDMKIQAAKRAYQLQSESLYKAELSQLKGVGWLPQGSVQMEGALRAGQLVSEKKYRQQPHNFQFTSIADSPDILHAKASYEKSSELAYRSAASGGSHAFTLPPDHPEFLRARANALHSSDRAYRESSRSARARGYDLRLDALSFQTARASRDIASDYKYKETFARERGRLVGTQSVSGDARILHGVSASRMQSSLRQRRDYDEARVATGGHYSLPADVASLVHAKRSQEHASDVGYRQPVASGTATSEQLSIKHAQHSHSLQSEKRYKADLAWMRGVGWVPPGSHKVEVARRAAERAASGADSGGPQRLPPAKPKAEMERQRVQGEEVMPDAFEVLHSKRRGKRM